ncbi:MAG: RDD family protein [Leptospirales bacterium]|nr:RDD family protein [Leptospirales bacterium]
MKEAVAYSIILGIYCLYFTLLEYFTGRTLGKILTRTRVVMHDGRPLEFTAAVYRTLFRSVLIGAFSFLPDRQPIGLHDRITKTRVIQA